MDTHTLAPDIIIARYYHEIMASTTFVGKSQMGTLLGIVVRGTILSLLS